MQKLCVVIAMLSTASVCLAGAMVLAFRNSPSWIWFLCAGLLLCFLAMLEDRRD
jgi:uncharacterized membrane protein HdeD (DUF308 family)